MARPNGHNSPHPLALRLSGTTWSRVSILPYLYILGGITVGPGEGRVPAGRQFPNGGSQRPVILKLAGSTWKR